MYTLIYGWIAEEQQFDDKIIWELEDFNESFEKKQDNDQIVMNNIWCKIIYFIKLFKFQYINIILDYKKYIHVNINMIIVLDI